MRPGFGQFNVATPEFLQFAAQFGATDVLLNTPLLPGAQRWELMDLVKLRLSVEQWGLKLSAIENVPPSFYDQIMLGGPRRARSAAARWPPPTTTGWASSTRPRTDASTPKTRSGATSSTGSASSRPS